MGKIFPNNKYFLELKNLFDNAKASKKRKNNLNFSSSSLIG